MTRSIIDGRYEIESRWRADFADGTKPSFLTEDTSGGGSVNYEAANGGRAVLSSGTAAVDDSARIRAEGVDYQTFDAVALRALVGHNSAAATPETTISRVGFENGDFSHKAFQNVNGEFRKGQIEVAAGGDTSFINVRDQLVTQPVPVEIVMDESAGELIHRYQDCLSRIITSTVPARSAGPFAADIFCRTENTAAERVMYVYRFEVLYLTNNDQ